MAKGLQVAGFQGVAAFLLAGADLMTIGTLATINWNEDAANRYMMRLALDLHTQCISTSGSG